MEDIADMLVYGPEFHAMDENMKWVTLDVIKAIPRPTVSTASPLASAAASRAPEDGIDRISRLPVEVLRNIVSRLPAKDAARTTALAKRWRRVWHSVPLVLVDAHLLSASGVLNRDRSPYRGMCLEALVVGMYRIVDGPFYLADTVSRILAAHPGPFGFVYLVNTNMETLPVPDQAARWLQLLGAKGVKELVFMNLAIKIQDNVHIPATLFKCTALTKLYIGTWWFPDTADLPRTAAFPYLRELGLCNLVMKEKDLTFLLDRCPVLEKLMIARSRLPVCIRIVSRSLRSVQVCMGLVPEITVANASRLERLLLWEAWGSPDLTNMSSKVKIGHAPKLRFLGFFVPGMHQLEIGNTVIKANTKASPNTAVPSVQMLGVQVKLGTHIEARMLPSFLRCFPNIETLYVQSEDDELKFWGPQRAGTGKVNLKFWKDAGPIECIQRCIKKLVLREFRGRKSELDFLKFIAENAQVLEEMVIVMTHGYSPSDNLGAKLRIFMASAKWANGRCKMMVVKSPFDQEGTAWCHQRGFDFSIEDPFDVSKCLGEKCSH